MRPFNMPIQSSGKDAFELAYKNQIALARRVAHSAKEHLETNYLYRGLQDGREHFEKRLRDRPADRVIGIQLALASLANGCPCIAGIGERAHWISHWVIGHMLDNSHAVTDLLNPEGFAMIEVLALAAASSPKRKHQPQVRQREFHVHDEIIRDVDERLLLVRGPSTYPQVTSQLSVIDDVLWQATHRACWRFIEARARPPNQNRVNRNLDRTP